MTEPVSFPSATPRHALPMLFTAQAQKEITVNESLLAADVLLQPVVEGIATTPPASPVRGQCWIVGNAATGAFSGHDSQIAAWSDSGWRFFAPMPGARVHDQGLGAERFYIGTWQRSVAPATPTGGTVVDTQARSAIAAIIQLLTTSGTFSVA